jgi:hypothetical protein
MIRALRSILILVATVCTAQASIIVNSAMTIDRQVVVQLIQARETNGTSPATVFGDASQRLQIEAALDQIWAQAGIDISILPAITFYDNSFALDRNNNTSGDRPIGDFDTIFVQAASAGVLNNGNAINAIFVDYVPGFPIVSENSAAGLASLPGDQITMFSGENLLTFANGRDVIASVFAHEIGHNLGLDHIGNDDNLMAAFNSSSERLNASQISTARSSNLLRVIPEPGAAWLIGVSLVSVGARRMRNAV